MWQTHYNGHEIVREYTFEDGIIISTCIMDRAELLQATIEHGGLVQIQIVALKL